jgi:hypothetical protein
MVQHFARDLALRVLAVALAVALAFAVGVAVTLLLAPPALGTGAAGRISRPTGGAAGVRAPGPGRAVGDLVTGDPRWGQIACPPGKRPGAGGESAVICVAGAP